MTGRQYRYFGSYLTRTILRWLVLSVVGFTGKFAVAVVSELLGDALYPPKGNRLCSLQLGRFGVVVERLKPYPAALLSQFRRPLLAVRGPHSCGLVTSRINKCHVVSILQALFGMLPSSCDVSAPIQLDDNYAAFLMLRRSVQESSGGAAITIDAFYDALLCHAVTTKQMLVVQFLMSRAKEDASETLGNLFQLLPGVAEHFTVITAERMSCSSHDVSRDGLQEVQTSIAVPFHDGCESASASELIGLSLQQRTLSDWKCAKQDARRHHTPCLSNVITSIRAVRDCLVIHVLRFVRTGMGRGDVAIYTKQHSPLLLHATLELMVNSMPQTFHLCGVVAHLGDSKDTGHYVAYVREFREDRDVTVWRKCDDSTAPVLYSADWVFTEVQKTCYLLFYRRLISS